MAQTVYNLPAMSETWARSLSWEDLLDKGMATHSSILAWRTPWTEEPGGLQSMGLHRVGHDWSDPAGMHARAGLSNMPRATEAMLISRVLTCFGSQRPRRERSSV